MIERCLIVDAETSGLSHETDRCTEPGAILYSLRNAATCCEFSYLKGGVQTNPEAERLTGITQAMLDEMKTVERLITEATGDYFLGRLIQDLSTAADCVIAHNVDFDRGWPELAINTIPWLCTMEDFRFPGVAPGGKLTETALALGVPVVSAHRALTDCRLIASIFTRCAELGHDLQEMFAVAGRPKALFAAVDHDDFWGLPNDEREAWKALRSQHGFRYSRLVHKKWARRMPVEDAAALPFKVREVRQ